MDPPEVEIKPDHDATLHWRALQDGLSRARLRAYMAGVDEAEAQSRYRQNLALSEALYPGLHFLEVGLRNALHRQISAAYATEYWYDLPWLRDQAQDDVAKAKMKLASKAKAVEPDRVVSELTFGFWCSLFNRHYEHGQRLWPRMVKPVFPYLPKSLRSVRALERNLNDLRTLRNRVFHFEPIWHWRDLPGKHDIMRRLVAGMSPALAAMLDSIDRFPQLLKTRQ